MRVLVVNTGSSSLRIAVLDAAGGRVVSWNHPPLGDPDLTDALSEALDKGGRVDASGHRLVHGGERFTEPTVLDASIEDELVALSDLAPLHNPPALAAIKAMRSLRSGLPAVACFDTAFHATLPPAARTYALPVRWTTRWPLRRYGFHGLSHAWIAKRVPELLDCPADKTRIISCHLGAGASLAAIDSGRAIDTTMGFTPMDGLVMATRPGAVDPGLLLWVQRHGKIAPVEAERELTEDAGLLGLSGHSGDFRKVFAAAKAGNERCQLALAVYVHRLRAGIAAMAAAMDGVDAVAVTGGVGEGSAWIRGEAAAGLGFLGLEVDPALNGSADTADRLVSHPAARIPVLVVAAREDLQIATEVRHCVAGSRRAQA